MKYQSRRVVFVQLVLPALVSLSFSSAAPAKLVHIQQLESYLNWSKSAFKALDRPILGDSEIRNWNIDIQDKRKEFDNKFGMTNRDYSIKFNGICSSGFFNIASLMGDLSNFATGIAFGKKDAGTREYIVDGIKKSENSIKDCKKQK
jgi:hypothetical protein